MSHKLYLLNFCQLLSLDEILNKYSLQKEWTEKHNEVIEKAVSKLKPGMMVEFRNSKLFNGLDCPKSIQMNTPEIEAIVDKLMVSNLIVTDAEKDLKFINSKLKEQKKKCLASKSYLKKLAKKKGIIVCE